MWKVKAGLAALGVLLFTWVQHLAKKSGKQEAEKQQLKKELDNVKKTKIVKAKVAKDTKSMSDDELRNELYR